ncbi:MAG TPA: ferritin-like domain-containing protein [Chitinophagaceae bacterium]|nr:ferritin-like domain-containing protein [Chitinophagaceae bacterium]
MNITNIIKEIEKVDPEVYGRLDSRRSAMKNFASIGGKIALAAVPLALGAVFQKAYAGTRGVTGDTVVDILNYALTLEYLEAAFYAKGVASPGLIPAGDTAAGIALIAKHEMNHVDFLKAAIGAAGGKAVDAPQFDFTAKGTFNDVFSNFETFLNVAQTFEDTGVRAYKGRAAEIVGGGDYLTAALRIHSVEARHAAHIRGLRKAYGSGIGNVKPWITGKMSGINSSAVQASYDGEELTSQATISIVNINGFSISADAASEAFDEPLTKDQVLAIVGPFFKS